METGTRDSSSCNRGVSLLAEELLYSVEHVDRLVDVYYAYRSLPLPQHDHAPVTRPAQRQSPRAQVYRLHAPLAPHVPELADPVHGQRSQLRLLRGIPCHPLHRTRVAAQLGAVLDLWLVWVPDAEGAVLRAGCYEVAGRVPGYGADSVRTWSAEQLVTGSWGEG